MRDIFRQEARKQLDEWTKSIASGPSRFTFQAALGISSAELGRKYLQERRKEDMTLLKLEPGASSVDINNAYRAIQRPERESIRSPRVRAGIRLTHERFYKGIHNAAEVAVGNRLEADASGPATAAGVPRVTRITVTATPAVAGGSIGVVFRGENIGPDTWFDVTIVRPDGERHYFENWQQTKGAHRLDGTEATGQYQIVEVRAHDDKMDHSAPMQQLIRSWILAPEQTDQSSEHGPARGELSVIPPLVTPTGLLGQGFRYRVTIANSNLAARFEMAESPEELSINAETGEITGVMEKEGSYSIRVRAECNGVQGRWSNFRVHIVDMEKNHAYAKFMDFSMKNIARILLGQETQEFLELNRVCSELIRRYDKSGEFFGPVPPTAEQLFEELKAIMIEAQSLGEFARKESLINQDFFVIGRRLNKLNTKSLHYATAIYHMRSGLMATPQAVQSAIFFAIAISKLMKLLAGSNEVVGNLQTHDEILSMPHGKRDQMVIDMHTVFECLVDLGLSSPEDAYLHFFGQCYHVIAADLKKVLQDFRAEKWTFFRQEFWNWFVMMAVTVDTERAFYFATGLDEFLARQEMNHQKLVDLAKRILEAAQKPDSPLVRRSILEQFFRLDIGPPKGTHQSESSGRESA